MADYQIVKEEGDVVFLVDLDQGGTTVTNDAEAVVRDLITRYGPERRFVYRDTMGAWDELTHDGEAFIDFIPWGDDHPLMH